MVRLNSSDYIVIILFIFLSMIVPILIGFLKRREGFFQQMVAGRKLGLISVALAMYLSENGTAQLTGMTGWAVHAGLGIYAYELVGCIGLVTLGWVFLPVYKAAGVYTTIDYTHKRFGGKRIGFMMVFLMIFINIVAKLSVELQITHVMLAELYHISHYTINIILLACSLLVIIPAGLYSIVFSSNVQFVFFIIGIPVFFLYSYSNFISWQEIQTRYQKAWPNTTIEHVRTRDHSKYTHCGMPDIHSLDLIRAHSDKDMPWPGMIFGIYIISIYNFCIDQSILQFCLGAKDTVSAKYACIISAFFKVTTIFLVIPGFIARILYTDLVACAEPDVCQLACDKRSGCADLALPMLFRNVVPVGWHGLTLVTFVIATLTSIAATLYAGSTIFVLHLYRPLRGDCTEMECTIIRRLVELFQALVGMSLVSELNKIPAMHDFIRQIYSTMTPPLVAVYLIGIYWDKVTEKIAFRTLFFGSIVAGIRLTSKLSYGFVPCGEENVIYVPDIINNLHDLHFAILLYVLCCCYIVICAVRVESIDEVYLHRLLFWTRFNEGKRKDINLLRTSGVIGGSIFRGSGFQQPSLPSSIGKSILKDAEDEQKTDSSLDDVNEIKCFCFTLSRNLVKEKNSEGENHTKVAKETTKESQSLNALLILLLLVVAFIMGFFK